MTGLYDRFAGKSFCYVYEETAFSRSIIRAGFHSGPVCFRQWLLQGIYVFTERYVCVCDNTGSINTSALDAETGAIELWREGDEYSRFSDVASVLYIEKHNNNQYDIQAQGAGIYKMFGKYISLTKGNGYYTLSVTQNNVQKYLTDSNLNLWPDEGILGTNGGSDYRQWAGTKIDSNTDEWFGITPSVTLKNGKFYHPFYADFGFTPVSEDMKVWYISVMDKEGAVLKEFTGDVIPANMPVFIECASSVAAQNKLDIKYNRDAVPADNKLKGVYFNKPIRKGISKDACTEFDKSTMRVLGEMEDGRLGYVMSKVKPKSGKQYLAANQSYLVVEPDYPSEIPVITEAEYEEILAKRGDAAVHITTYTVPKDVYSLSGRYIGKLTGAQIGELSPGIYIIDRKKVTVE